MTRAWHKQAPKRHFGQAIWQIFRAYLMKRSRMRQGYTLKCHRGAGRLPHVSWVKRRCGAIEPPQLALLFASESHFDDCQCDFNTIFQLDTRVGRSAFGAQSETRGCACHVYSRSCMIRNKKRAMARNCARHWAQCWHLWIKLQFVLM